MLYFIDFDIGTEMEKCLLYESCTVHTVYCLLRLHFALFSFAFI